MDPSRGQFISQDPVFWEIGITKDGKNALLNPQTLHSYAYANDNPITGKDPKGRCGEPITAAIASWPERYSCRMLRLSVFNADGTVSATPEQARQLKQHFSSADLQFQEAERKMPAAQSNIRRKRLLKLRKILGPEYAKMLEQGGERAVLLGKAANDRVRSLAEQLYRATDKIPGGTPGGGNIYKNIRRECRRFQSL